MMVYLIIAFSLMVLFVLTAFNKFIPKDIKNDELKRIYKRTMMIVSGLLALAFILFAIAEMVDSLYRVFNVLAIIIIVGSIVYFFIENMMFNKTKEKK